MIIEPIYISKTETKTGLIIPVTKSNRTIESKYNPEKEAETLLNSITKDYKFFVLLGIGSGMFLSKLLQKFPESTVIAVDNTNEDINFIKSLNNFNIFNNKNILFTQINDIQNSIIQNYIPSLYGDLKIIEILPWINENKNYEFFIKNEINSAIKEISSDFSVQSHFGKIWQHNILNNIKSLKNDILISTTKKECAIIAAGPTLDKKISYLKNNKNKLYIITTDTAYSTLLKNDIFPDIVVSIDGQFVSHSHFLHSKIDSETIFAFDLCADSSAVNHINPKQILFFTSGHPLSQLVNEYCSNNLLKLYSGAGTVTIAALDLAKTLGFSDIQVLGADFSYRDGKPYAKGTYLDSIYRSSGNKLSTGEYLYSKLQYRTELVKVSNNILSTQILDSYKNSFINYINTNNMSYEYKDDIYIITNSLSKQIYYQYSNSFPESDFFRFADNEFSKGNFSFLLPFISYLRMKEPAQSFDYLLNLAHSLFVSYNNKYEKK